MSRPKAHGVIYRVIIIKVFVLSRFPWRRQQRASTMKSCRSYVWSRENLFPLVSQLNFIDSPKMIYYIRSILRLLVHRKNLAEIWGVVEFYALTAPLNALEMAGVPSPN